jgi:hypothetical protein
MLPFRSYDLLRAVGTTTGYVWKLKGFLRAPGEKRPMRTQPEKMLAALRRMHNRNRLLGVGSGPRECGNQPFDLASPGPPLTE